MEKSSYELLQEKTDEEIKKHINFNNVYRNKLKSLIIIEHKQVFEEKSEFLTAYEHKLVIEEG